MSEWLGGERCYKRCRVVLLTTLCRPDRTKRNIMLTISFWNCLRPPLDPSQKANALIFFLRIAHAKLPAPENYSITQGFRAAVRVCRRTDFRTYG